VVERILLVWRRLVERTVDGAEDRVPAEEPRGSDAFADRGGIARVIALGMKEDLLAVPIADAIMTKGLGKKPRMESAVSGGASPAGARPSRAGLAWAPVVLILPLHDFPRERMNRHFAGAASKSVRNALDGGCEFAPPVEGPNSCSCARLASLSAVIYADQAMCASEAKRRPRNCLRL
jgi:hypothetical protein